MDSLIERLEGATEGSQVLDGEIFRLVDGRPDDAWVRFGDDGVWAARDPEDSVAFDMPPFYTHSIDVALTLVPKGLGWSVMTHGIARNADDVGPCAGVDGHFARAKTAVLALCIAALKARQSLKS